MKIGNWNIERLKKLNFRTEILEEINNRNFDILVLTEYDTRIEPLGFKYKIVTKSLEEINTDNYKKTERRTVIFSKYPITKVFNTYNKYTSYCAEINTEFGNLIVYGTIIGIYGNRNPNFKLDLESQILDFKKLSSKNNICIVGDYNQTFSDNYYFTKFGRETIKTKFKELDIINLTSEIKDNIDHIALSNSFLKELEFKIETWNLNKKLSDHIGISIKLTKREQKLNISKFN